jgi:hypothetical protein
VGLFLPNQRLDNELRIILRSGAEREDHVGQAQRRDSEIHHRVGRNDCGAADFRKDSRLVTITVSWLLPVPRDPYISVVTRHPVACDPNCGGPRTNYPRARHPYVGRAGPSPVAGCPNVARSGCHRLSFHTNRRRRAGDYNFSRRARRGHLLRGGCRRDRDWFCHATDQNHKR